MQTAGALERIDDWLGARPWAADGALAVVACLVLTTASWGALGTELSTSLRWLVGAAVLVAPAALAVRRSLPRASFAVISAALLVLALAPAIPGPPGSGLGTFAPILLPAALAFAPSLYTLAAYAPPPAPTAGLGIALIGAALSTARITMDSTNFAAPGQPWIVLFVAGALLAAVAASWGLGRLRRAHLDALRERADRAAAQQRRHASQAAMDERARIAREMHDIVAHSLSVIVAQAEGGRYAARADPGTAVAVLGTVAETGREALADMRGILGVLRTEQTTDAEPGTPGFGPQPTLADVPALVEGVRRSGLSVDLQHEGVPGPLDRAAELAGYRLIQEALTNVVQHAGPGARATVSLRWSADDLTVQVRNDGSGAPGPRSDGGGSGLLGMRERVHLAGGELSTGPEPSGGFLVQARLPTRTFAPDRAAP